MVDSELVTHFFFGLRSGALLEGTLPRLRFRTLFSGLNCAPLDFSRPYVYIYSCLLSLPPPSPSFSLSLLLSVPLCLLLSVSEYETSYPTPLLFPFTSRFRLLELAFQCCALEGGKGANSHIFFLLRSVLSLFALFFGFASAKVRKKRRRPLLGRFLNHYHHNYLTKRDLRQRCQHPFQSYKSI